MFDIVNYFTGARDAQAEASNVHNASAAADDDAAIGYYPSTSADDARERTRRQISHGTDPLQVRSARRRRRQVQEHVSRFVRSEHAPSAEAEADLVDNPLSGLEATLDVSVNIKPTEMKRRDKIAEGIAARGRAFALERMRYF